MLSASMYLCCLPHVSCAVSLKVVLVRDTNTVCTVVPIVTISKSDVVYQDRLLPRCVVQSLVRGFD